MARRTRGPSQDGHTRVVAGWTHGLCSSPVHMARAPQRGGAKRVLLLLRAPARLHVAPRRPARPCLMPTCACALRRSPRPRRRPSSPAWVSCLWVPQQPRPGPHAVAPPMSHPRGCRHQASLRLSSHTLTAHPACRGTGSHRTRAGRWGCPGPCCCCVVTRGARCAMGERHLQVWCGAV